MSRILTRRRELPVAVDVEGLRLGRRQRPARRFDPSPAMIEPARFGLRARAAAHEEQANAGLPIDAVRRFP